MKDWKNVFHEKSSGLVETAADALLFHFIVLAETIGSAMSWHGSDRDVEYALDELERIPHKTRDRAAQHLSAMGWLKRTGRDLAAWRITRAGIARLRSWYPAYRVHRPWNGRMYLITYDIPERSRVKRAILRDQLKKIGCGRLQASVWIAPYYPRRVLEEIASREHIPGSLLVSDLDRRGTIGEMTLRDLVYSVYHLDDLDARYADFIARYRRPLPSVTPFELYCAFTSIVRDDPQLPFALLPRLWVSNEAHRIYQRSLRDSLKKRKIVHVY